LSNLPFEISINVINRLPYV